MQPTKISEDENPYSYKRELNRRIVMEGIIPETKVRHFQEVL